MANDLKVFNGSSWVTPTGVSVGVGGSFVSCTGVYVYSGGAWNLVWPTEVAPPTGVPAFKPEWVLTGRPAGGTYDEVWLANITSGTWARITTPSFIGSKRIDVFESTAYGHFGQIEELMIVGGDGSTGSAKTYGNLYSSVETTISNVSLPLYGDFTNLTSAGKINDYGLRATGGLTKDLIVAGSNSTIGRVQNFRSNAWTGSSMGLITTTTSAAMNGVSFEGYYVVGDSGKVYIDSTYVSSASFPASPYNIDYSPLALTGDSLYYNPIDITSAKLNDVASDTTTGRTVGNGGFLGTVQHEVISGSVAIWGHTQQTGYNYYLGGIGGGSYTYPWTENLNKIARINMGAVTSYSIPGYPSAITNLTWLAVGDSGRILIFSQPPAQPDGGGWAGSNPSAVWWSPTSFGQSSNTSAKLNSCSSRTIGSGLSQIPQLIAVGNNSAIVISESFGYSWTPASSPSGYDWTAITAYRTSTYND